MDVGGSHVTAAVVDSVALASATGAAGVEARRPLTERAAVVDPHAPLEVLLEQLTAPGRAITDLLAGARAGAVRGWVVAMPGPFDYGAGTGSFAGVDKFASLAGVDLRAAFAGRLGVVPADVRFCNDAVAYALGEWAVGAGRRTRRMVCITLGTGVGSAFLEDGVEVVSGASVPPHGEVHRLAIDGDPLEDTMSTPALRRAFRDRTGQDRSVEEICALARSEDAVAVEVVHTALHALGTALGPWVHGFGADAVVVGGSIARSWDVIGTPVRDGLRVAGPVVSVVPAALGARAPLLGAAVRWERGGAEA
ncbi:ROK family protein [Curtobacterium sp. VKM Ac-1376]|uniref:ROK family protein n=1 Tax=Curtobacterium sp. VKM Ac-1376 TaxID=123312 RepID=UPI00188B909C|nr:ROK family protein [Curtobacterium sp. VKM Ac-1376]MBF4612986.1 ROK family protein [Curtobacterium sp. VKM Ac-1376]